MGGLSNAMKEDHLQVGDMNIFRLWMDKNNIPKIDGHKIFPMQSLCGLKIIEVSYLERNKALLVDKNGNVLQKFVIDLNS